MIQMRPFAMWTCFVIAGVTLPGVGNFMAQLVASHDAPVATGPSVPPLSPSRAVSAAAFLDSIGVNAHTDQGYDPKSYIEPLRYMGIREVRDGERHVESDVMIHTETGVRYTINGGGDVQGLLASARVLAAAGALLAVEGPNEPNNFPISYEGKKGGGIGGTWVPVALFQKDLYAQVKADPVLRRYPVFGPSEVGAETDNVGLQFLVIPPDADAVMPPGTRFADYVNVHNYVIGNGNTYRDNQAWNAASPTLNARWDGLYGNHGRTWYRRYQGYAISALPGIPRVTTETGWDTHSNPGGDRVQGTILTNTYLAQFKRGWSYTFVYELRDDEGGAGAQGLYRGTTPKLAATYLHNLTTILSDNASGATPGSLAYAIPDQPATVHDLLLQKSTGEFALVVWDERVEGNDAVTVELGEPGKLVTIYDITSGTHPVTSLKNASSVPLTLSDHAVIIELIATKS
jgi:hypothetical protein